MCGLNGIYAYAPGASSPMRDELLVTRDAMYSRGPDGCGEWWTADRRVGLGHRRLAIQDLSDRALQPMSSVCGRFHIVFNGEIYNYPDLKRQVETQGQALRTSSDTEILLVLYARLGRAMVHIIRGMFAFAIWDNLTKTIFLARDPYGIKPLYISDYNGTFRFASQVKAIVAGGHIPKDLNPAGIVGFMLWGSVPDPHTLFRHIRALPAGHTMLVSQSGPGEPERYHSIAEVLASGADKSVSHDKMDAEAREALCDSVRAHLLSDVEVGLFLSRGIDSGALLGILKDVGAHRIRAITLSFEDYVGTNFDEGPAAQRVADLYGSPHVLRNVGKGEFEEDLPRILEAMDQPTIDGLNMWFVAKAAKEAGLKVALSGVGGDELFAGYTSFRDIPLASKIQKFLSCLPYSRSYLSLISKYLAKRSGRPKLAAIFEEGGGFADLYRLRRGLFLPSELRSILEEKVLYEGLTQLSSDRVLESCLIPDPRSSIGRVLALESTQYMRNQLLRDADWAGMAHGVEVRTPLVDVCLLQSMAPIVPHMRYKRRKRLLANAPLTPLPEEVTRPRKLGFSVPTEHWVANTKNVGARRGLSSRQWAVQLLKQFENESSGSFFI